MEKGMGQIKHRKLLLCSAISACADGLLESPKQEKIALVFMMSFK